MALIAISSTLIDLWLQADPHSSLETSKTPFILTFFLCALSCQPPLPLTPTPLNLWEISKQNSLKNEEKQTLTLIWRKDKGYAYKIKKWMALSKIMNLILHWLACCYVIYSYTSRYKMLLNPNYSVYMQFELAL